MSQSSATKLISKLRFKLNDRRRLRNVDGPVGRHDKIKKIVTALFKHERIETNYRPGDESRGYAERLISDAIRYGDFHKPTMEMASYWIIEKPVIHKLFKVLAPRYKDFELSYTKLWQAPNIYTGHTIPKCILELRNNIYPPLGPDKSYNKNLIHNVLLEEAKKAYHKKKAEEIATDNSQTVENTQTKVTNRIVECGKMINIDVASDLSSEESKTNNKSDSSLEADLDLSKMEILEEKPKETDSENVKK